MIRTNRPRAGVYHRLSAALAERFRRGAEDADVASLSGALPADDQFPAASIGRAMRATMADDGLSALQYGWAEGLDPLRDHVSRWMDSLGVDMTAADVLITNGAQQGIHHLARLLVPSGGKLAVEVPTYTAALQCFDLQKPVYVGVDRGRAGLDLDALEAALRGGATVLYLVATGHNPTGGVLPDAERRAVLDLAERWDTWIIDDDAYGMLAYDGVRPPPLRAYGRHLHRIVHLGTYSKVLAPGLRVGWMVGPVDLIRQATILKQAQDLETASLTQGILSRWLDENDLLQHILTVRPVYQHRRDTLISALSALAPPEWTWEAPEAGFSLLLRIPADADAFALHALDRGVLVEPASPYFVVAERGAGSVRLSFSNCAPGAIVVAVERLAEAWRSFRP